MDEWAFLTMAKTKSELRSRSGVVPAADSQDAEQSNVVLSKVEAALAMGYEVAEQHAGFRGAVSLTVAAIINVAFFGGIELTALNARTPAGEVVVAELDHGAYDSVTASL